MDDFAFNPHDFSCIQEVAWLRIAYAACGRHFISFAAASLRVRGDDESAKFLSAPLHFLEIGVTIIDHCPLGASSSPIGSLKMDDQMEWWSLEVKGDKKALDVQ
ncbi:hypothetical protein ACLOJK_001916 [Asimina triloba]